MGGSCCCGSVPQFAQRQQKRQNNNNTWVKELNLRDATTIQEKMIVGDWGQVEEKVNMRGKGVIFVPGSFYYEGDVVGGEAEGTGVIFWEDIGESQYEGKVSHNQPHGQGQYINQFYELSFNGEWMNGQMSSGSLKIKHQMFQISSITPMRDKKYEIDVILPNFSHYQGQAQIQLCPFSLLFDGKGRMTFPNGNKYKGEWSKGKMEGEGEYEWIEERVKYKGPYVGGKKHGKGKYYLAERKYLSGKWVEGKKQGEFRVIEETDRGQKNLIYSCTYHNDEL